VPRCRTRIQSRRPNQIPEKPCARRQTRRRIALLFILSCTSACSVPDQPFRSSSFFSARPACLRYFFSLSSRVGRLNVPCSYGIVTLHYSYALCAFFSVPSVLSVAKASSSLRLFT